MKYDKNDNVVRTILYEVNRKRNSKYFDETMSFTDFEIDHIISVKCVNSDDELRAIKEKYNLNSNFEINSLYNYRPTSRKLNNIKQDRLPNDEVLSYLLQDAEKLAPEISKKIEKALIIGDVMQKMASIKASFDALTDDEKVEQANILLGNRYSYSENEQILNNVLTRSTEKIRITAFLPTIENRLGSFLLTFQLYNISGLLITPTFEDLASSLFVNAHSSIFNNSRPFIINDGKSRKSFVQISTSRFNLSQEEVLELCSHIDRYFDLMASTLIDIESKTLTTHYKLMFKNYYSVLSLSRELYNSIQGYIRAVTNNHIESKWKFDMNYHFIRVMNTDMEKSCFFDLDLWSYDYKGVVHLLYNQSYLPNPNSTSSSHCRMSICDVDKWLINELIPEVLKWESILQNRKKFRFRFLSGLFFNISVESERMKCIDNEIKHNSDIYNIDVNKSYELTEFFAICNVINIFMEKRNSIYYSREIHINIIKNIIILAENCANYLSFESIKYLCGNMSGHNSFVQRDTTSVLGFIGNLNNEIRNLESGTKQYYGYGFIMRNIVFLTEKSRSIPSALQHDFFGNFSILIDYFNKKKIIEKQTDYIINE